MTATLLCVLIAGSATAVSPSASPHHNCLETAVDVVRPDMGYDVLLPALDSLNCRRAGSWPFGTAMAVAADSARRLAFVSSDGGVLVFDVSDPAHPAILSDDIRTRGVVNGLLCQGSILYVAAGRAGIELWDVSNRTAPVLFGCANIPGDAQLVHVVDTIAYVASGDSGLRIVNVAEPSAPREIGSVVTNRCRYVDVFVRGTVAYAVDEYCKLVVIDISDPTHPDSLYVADLHGNGVYSIAVRDSWVFTAGDLLLGTVSIADPLRPREVTFFYTGGETYDIVLDSSYAYIWGGESLLTLDMSNPVSPVVVGMSRPLSGSNFALAGNLLHLVGSDYAVMDVTDPVHPGVLSNTEMPGGGNFGVWMADTLVYLAGFWKGLQIVDVSNPAHPTGRGRCAPPNNICCVTVEGNYAYAGGDGGINVIDVSDPDIPRVVAHRDTQALGIFALDSVLYSCGVGAMVLWKITDPPNIVHRSTYGLPAIGRDIWVRYPYAYVADDVEGLEIVDVSDPDNPQLAGRCNPGGSIWGIHVQGSFVFLADARSGHVRVVDVSDPTNPRLLDSLRNSGGYTCDVWASGNHLYSVSRYRMSIVDFSDPMHLREVGYYNGPSLTWALSANDSLIFTATDHAGLQIYDPLVVTGLTADDLDRGHGRLIVNPCPAGGNSRIRIGGLRAGTWSIALVDASGRVVRTEPVSGTTASLLTSGLSSGVYLVRAGADRARVVLLP